MLHIYVMAMKFSKPETEPRVFGVSVSLSLSVPVISVQWLSAGGWLLIVHIRRRVLLSVLFA